jgi:glucosamine--fructose-6-phosphate aminotransferase (isomerizing)
MCGIVGYVGHQDAVAVVVSGLKRLEYRGYDSAGVAAFDDNGQGLKIRITRAEGKIENLVRGLEKEPFHARSAIGHTRWATHGRPSERNAHPHRYKDVVIVHNGIIENYAELKAALMKKGHEFSSDTDSEVIAHLLQVALDREQKFEPACEWLVNELEGAFAISAFWNQEPEKIFVAKQACPLVLGLGKNENFVASDIPALLDYTKDFIFLDDGEMAFVGPQGCVIKNFKGRVIPKKSVHISWSLGMAEREGYPHFMLKEIYEQPRVLRDCMRGRIESKFDGLYFDTLKWKTSDWKKIQSVSLVACGTAWHAGLIGRYWIEKFARVRAENDLASEFRYREPVAQKNSSFIAISQSGETADTLAALQEAIRLKMLPLAITNSVESSIARKAKNVVYTHAGPEIAVASTKCFTAQLAVLAMVAIQMAVVRKSQSPRWVKSILKDLVGLPEKIEETLKLNDQILELAKRYSQFNQYFYMGRGLSYPVALEGALKLKEIAYINTQAYPAGEMKHGPIALISDDWPVVCVAPNGEYQEKMLSNTQEVRARGGQVILIGTQGMKNTELYSQEFIGIPEVREEFSPFLTTVVLQLFAYHMSVLRGCDVDKPKNLAKSVTVE